MLVMTVLLDPGDVEGAPLHRSAKEAATFDTAAVTFSVFSKSVFISQEKL